MLAIPVQTPESSRAFSVAVAEHATALNRRALRLTANESAAADLVQDALVRAYRFWHTFTPGTGVRAWLFTILRNTHATAYQTAKRRREVMADHRANVEALGAEVMPGADASAEALETRTAVREAVESLPEAYRAAVRMVDLEGASYREAAEALGCAEGTIMSRLSRGRKRLAVTLEDAA
jgi:RNA polymerase sigma-70 factor (ECF subfamily)